MEDDEADDSMLLFLSTSAEAAIIPVLLTQSSDFKCSVLFWRLFGPDRLLLVGLDGFR